MHLFLTALDGVIDERSMGMNKKTSTIYVIERVLWMEGFSHTDYRETRSILDAFQDYNHAKEYVEEDAAGFTEYDFKWNTVFANDRRHFYFGLIEKDGYTCGLRYTIYVTNLVK